MGYLRRMAGTVATVEFLILCVVHDELQYQARQYYSAVDELQLLDCILLTLMKIISVSG